MAGIKQILFCHKKHKFQEKNAGAKLVLVSVFLVRSNTVRVGVDDLIKQNGCLCYCVVRDPLEVYRERRGCGSAGERKVPVPKNHPTETK